MPTNKKNIIIIVCLASIIFLGLIIFILSRPGLFMFTAIPISGPDTRYPAPIMPPFAPQVATSTSMQKLNAPVDTRSWGERLNDKKLPDFGQIKLKIYTNTKYGFTLQYPDEWEIKKSDMPASGGVAFEFVVSSPTGAGTNKLILNIYKGVLRSRLAQTSSEWAARIRTYGFIPDATIDGLDAFIYDSKGNSHSTLLDFSFEKNGFIYNFNESFFTDDQDKKIIEHIIKKFYSFIPIQPSKSLDTRSWGERFRDKTIPHVPDIIWQIYANKEFGFQIDYPKGWTIEKEQTMSFEFPSILFKKDDIEFLRLAIFKGELRKHLIDTNLFWAERINTYGFIPDANIDDINVLINYAKDNGQDTLLELHLEKNGFNYNFFESFSIDNKYKMIVEHMVKSFHFLK